MKSLLDRFEEKYIPEPNSGCFIWLGGTDQKGYGIFGIPKPRHTERAHRLAWKFHVGPIPDELQVLHRCDNPSCVNWQHLFLGTNLDNRNDMLAKGRHGWNLAAAWALLRTKTHCKNGHPLSGENLRMNRQRVCRTCEREAGRRYRKNRVTNK